MSRILVLGLSALVVLTPVSLALAAGPPPPTVTNTPPSSVNIVVPGVTPPPLTNTPPPNRFLPSSPGGFVTIQRPVAPPVLLPSPPTPTPLPSTPGGSVTFPSDTPPPPLFNTGQPSVPIVFPVPPPPATPQQGLGTPNDFATLATPGSTSFQPGVFNPFNNPHPMLPWGDGQIGGQRYGQVLRYWENQPQTVSNVRFEQAAAPPQELDSNPQPQGQPGTPSGALSAKVVAKEPAPQSVTVPAYWIVETTRGYLHMPRWVLQEVGGGYYRWALVSGWFQPR